MQAIEFAILGNKANLVLKKLGRYRIGKNPIRGCCDPPTENPRCVYVDSRLTDYELIEVLLHESLHLAGWHIDEGFIEKFAADFAELLERLEVLE